MTDDGPGVPIEDWESVFEPFVRIGGTRPLARLRHRAVRRPTAHGGHGWPGLPRAQRLRRLAVRGGAAGRLDVAGWSRSCARRLDIDAPRVRDTVAPCRARSMVPGKPLPRVPASAVGSSSRSCASW